LACAAACAAADGVWHTPIRNTIVRTALAIGLDESTDLQLWRTSPPRPTEYIPQTNKRKQFNIKQNKMIGVSKVLC
jgi:hypothetical protein